MTASKIKWAAGVLAACGALALGAGWAAGPGSEPAEPLAHGQPVAAATPPAPAGQDRGGGDEVDDPVKLFLAMQKKVAAAKTLRVRFDLRVTGADGGEGTVKGSLTLGEGDKYRVELDGKVFGRVVKETEVSDGTTINSAGSGPVAGVEKSPKGAGAYLRQALPVEGFFLSSLNLDRRADRKAEEFRPTDLKAGGKEKIAGREAHVVHFTLPAGGDGAGAKGMPAAVWLDAETGLPLKFAVTGGTSDVREVTETYTEFALDPKVDAKTFALPKDKNPPTDEADDPKPQREDAAIEKVVADALEAGRKMDWERYAELVHPDSLQDYKNMWLPLLQVATKESPDKQADLLSAFDKATDLKTLMALKPKEFFVSSMKGMAAQFSKLKASPLNVNEKIIGTVHEGKDRAYVVVRTRGLLPRTEMTRVEVIALKRSGTEWKMTLPDVIRVMAETTGRMRPDTQKAGPVTDRADPDK